MLRNLFVTRFLFAYESFNKSGGIFYSIAFVKED